MHRFVKGTFLTDSQATIGASLFTKVVEIEQEPVEVQVFVYFLFEQSRFGIQWDRRDSKDLDPVSTEVQMPVYLCST